MVAVPASLDVRVQSREAVSHPVAQQLISLFQADVIRVDAISHADWQAFVASGASTIEQWRQISQPVVDGLEPLRGAARLPAELHAAAAGVLIWRWVGERQALRAALCGERVETAGACAIPDGGAAFDALVAGRSLAHGWARMRASSVVVRDDDGCWRARIEPRSHPAYWDGSPWIVVIDAEGRPLRPAAWIGGVIRQRAEAVAAQERQQQNNAESAVDSRTVVAHADDPQLIQAERGDRTMGGFNTVMIGGNLVHDPNVQIVGQRGEERMRASFRMAVEPDEDGQDPAFVDVLLSGRQAEIIGQYIMKGSAVIVEGRLKESVWEWESGREHRRVVIIAKRVEFIGEKRTNTPPGKASKITP